MKEKYGNILKNTLIVDWVLMWNICFLHLCWSEIRVGQSGFREGFIVVSSDFPVSLNPTITPYLAHPPEICDCHGRGGLEFRVLLLTWYFVSFRVSEVHCNYAEVRKVRGWQLHRIMVKTKPTSYRHDTLRLTFTTGCQIVLLRRVVLSSGK